MIIFKNNLLNQKGQALLIVVLVMVVALTVTLSLVSRSVVDLKTSTDQANSQKALAAAEAGVEQAIKNNVGIAEGTSLDNTAYSATITQVAGSASFLVNGGNLITKDEGVYIWLSTYNASNPFSDHWPSNGSPGTLTIYWGDSSGPCSNAALEIVVLSRPVLPPSPVLTRYAIDPCPARASANHFTLISASVPAPPPIGEKSFVYKTTISVTRGLLVSVNPIYYSAYIGANGTSLPPQGSIITSSGSSGGAGSVSRKVTVFQGYPQLPAVLFPYSILSP